LLSTGLPSNNQRGRLKQSMHLIKIINIT
jgi:hypothetical protein